jgi:hypothetical protein
MARKLRNDLLDFEVLQMWKLFRIAKGMAALLFLDFAHRGHSIATGKCRIESIRRANAGDKPEDRSIEARPY